MPCTAVHRLGEVCWGVHVGLPTAFRVVVAATLSVAAPGLTWETFAVMAPSVAVDAIRTSLATLATVPLISLKVVVVNQVVPLSVEISTPEGAFIVMSAVRLLPLIV